MVLTGAGRIHSRVCGSLVVSRSEVKDVVDTGGSIDVIVLSLFKRAVNSWKLRWLHCQNSRDSLGRGSEYASCRGLDFLVDLWMLDMKYG